MNEKIMIVDDNPEVRELVGTILERAGYEPLPKGTAAELRASFDEAAPEVVLLDVALPDGDGMELLPQIKQQWPKTQVIMLTGNATYDRAVGATKLGAFDFLPKPFDEKVLLASVGRALEHRHQTYN
jgi:DNA-binding NtrC family response regulator